MRAPIGWLRDFAARNDLAYSWIDLDTDDRAAALLRELGVEPAKTPKPSSSVSSRCRMVQRRTPISPRMTWRKPSTAAGPASR